MATLVTAIVGIAIGVGVGIVLFSLLGVNLILRILVAALAIVLLPMMTYFVLMGSPASKAKARARDIDKRIAAAMSFISAMASADVNIDVIFKELSRQKVYGEISQEAAWITRDTELLGSDILTAIKKAAKRSPSSKFQDFLQGVVTTSTSGGQLKPYFLLKAEEYQKENKLAMKSQMETLGMLAESFVTVVVAFPLFLVLIMAIMAIVGGGDPDFMVIMLYVVVLLMIPISQFGFVFVIWNMSKESAM
jgi:flagellar protein FlaJ